MSTAVSITDTQFDALVRQSAQPVLVDFWASWCPPCRAMEPTVEDLAEKYAGVVTVGKLDVDANPKTAGQFGVQSIPTWILFLHGEPVQRLVGVQPRELLEGLLEGTLASDGFEPLMGG